MKTLALRIVLSFSCIVISAQAGNYSYSFSPNQSIPDDDFSGVTLRTNLAGMIGLITDVTLSLNIANGFNGDLYAYVSGPNGGFSVLLNRVGVTTGDSFGYTNTGFAVTFDDSVTHNDVHFYQGFGYALNGAGQLTGTWSSDGRAVDPLSNPSLFASASRSALLDSFNGTDPNGTWTLFLSDLSGGQQSVLKDWQLNITTVPEPSTFALLGLGAIIFLSRLRSPRRKS